MTFACRFLLLTLSLCLLLAAGASAAQADKRLQVVTTLFPLYDWARVIGGEEAEVRLLLPPGIEAHSYDPKPKDIVQITSADIFLYIGAFMEPWVEGLLAGTSANNLLVIEASAGIQAAAALSELENHSQAHNHLQAPSHSHGHAQPDRHGGEESEPAVAANIGNVVNVGEVGEAGEADPHIWLEFHNAAAMMANVVAGFVARDPANGDLYERRGEEYRQKLLALDAEFATGLSDCRHRTIIYGGHFAFGHFARRFQLSHISPYRGFAPDSQPRPSEMIELSRQMRDGGYRYIFFEEGIDPKVARVIAAETGAGLLLLHGAHNLSRDELAAGVSYLSLMAGNLVNLRQGLECR